MNLTGRAYKKERMSSFTVIKNVKEGGNNISALHHTSLCCNLIGSMQKDVALLQREISKLTPLEEQYREYLKEFLQLTQLIDSKLYALWTTGVQFEPQKNLKAKEFVHSITAAWKAGDEEIRRTIRYTQLVSQYYPDITLERFVQATRAHFSELRKNIDTIPRHSRCNQVAYSKNNEINQCLNHLSHLDNILQHYISFGRANPFLHNIDHVIDQFILQEGFLEAIYGLSGAEKIQAERLQQLKLPTFNITANRPSDISGFQVMTKLLTGELLGNEPLDPHSGLEPLVRDSKLEIYLVPYSSVKNADKELIWKRLSDFHQIPRPNDVSVVKLSQNSDTSSMLKSENETSIDKKSISSNKEQVNEPAKLPYRETTPPWKHRKQKFREYLGPAVDADLQPIKIPRIEGALLPPLT